MSYLEEYLPFDMGINSVKAKIKWLMILRVIIVSILLGSISIVQFRYEKSFLTPFFVLIAITYLLTILYSVLYHNLINITVFAYIQLIGDIIIETTIIYLTGGIESPFSFTFILTIITASIIISRNGSLIIASLSAIGYGLLLDLQYFGTLSLPLSYIPMSKALSSAYVFHTIFINTCAFYLTALLSGYLTESRMRVNRQLIAREEDLLELKAFNEDVLKNMHSALIVTDLDGKITIYNKSAMDILDLRYNNNQEVYWKDLFSDIDFNTVICSLNKNQKRILTQNASFQYKKKEERFLGFRITLLKDSKGQAKGIISCIQDLTEFKKLEEKMKQNELLAYIGSMAAGIAHELRNPLASIRGSIQLLAEGIKLDQEQEKLLEIILRESYHLNVILDDFLLYARPKTPNMEKCNINNIIQDTIVILKNADDFNKNIEIILNLEADNQYLFLDMNLIKEVFLNLALNAFQAMPKGGTLTIRTFTDNSLKTIEFQDTGVGILKKNLPELFHPFFTTKEHGTGLGLSIAYRIIGEHGGKIEADPNVKKGSIFRIYLPINNIS